MKKLKGIIIFTLFISISAFFTGCNSNSSSSIKKNVSLTISAAASLKDSMNEIKQLYEKSNPEMKITYNFGASGTLQKQIEQGAPSDLFVSAATKQMNELKNKNLLVDSTIKNLLKNDIVLIVPKDSTKVNTFDDLAGSSVGKLALGEPKSVPVGQYSSEILNNLKIMDKVQQKAVYGKDVKEVLSWVETGSADAGIVYKTDALVSKKVKIVSTAPSNSHKEVVYPAAVVRASKNQTDAKKFLNYLSGEKAQKVFEKYGFKVGR